MTFKWRLNEVAFAMWDDVRSKGLIYHVTCSAWVSFSTSTYFNHSDYICFISFNFLISRWHSLDSLPRWEISFRRRMCYRYLWCHDDVTRLYMTSSFFFPLTIGLIISSFPAFWEFLNPSSPPFTLMGSYEFIRTSSIPVQNMSVL